MRKTIVDTLATVVFFTVIAALTELFLAGLSPAEVVRTRLTMIPLMLLTGRPYGAWRDWLFARAKPVSSWAKTVADGFAFLSFQLPVYGFVLMLVGANTDEIIMLLSSTAVLMLVISRPFGLFLEGVRRAAGVADR